MNGYKPLIALLLLAVCFIATMQAAEGENKSAKIDKQPAAKKKLQQAKTAEVAAIKLRVARSPLVAAATSGSGKLLELSSKLTSKASHGLDLMAAAGEKKYMLVKKKPKHKKIKMEVFKPKMKYKKIKMKIPVKKMKKKKVKGYLVKKEHGHGHEY